MHLIMKRRSVYAFLVNKIKYLDIPMTIEKIIVRHQNILQPVIEI